MMTDGRHSRLLLLAVAWLIVASCFSAQADEVTVTSNGGHNFTGVTNVTLPAGRVSYIELPPDPNGVIGKTKGTQIIEELVLERPLGADVSWRAWRDDVNEFGSGNESYTLTVSILVSGTTDGLKYLGAWPSVYEIFAGPNDQVMERLVIQYNDIDLAP